MALFVYVTDKCKADARTYNVEDELEKFRARLLMTQSTSSFDPFPPPFLVKKKLGGRQNRLVADLRTVGEHGVVVLRTILIRGNRQYEDFANDPRGYGEQHLEKLAPENDLANFVEEQTRTPSEPPKPNPSTGEYSLLYEAFAHSENSADDLVFETERWMHLVTQDRISIQLALIGPTCLEALSLEPGLHGVPVQGKQAWTVWCFRTEDRLMLLTLGTENNASDEEKFARSIGANLDGKDRTAYLRISRRAYPALMLADDEAWIKLETDPLANMTLSPEESEVLKSASNSRNPFPLFINGRAGSGKSTILQYLFADLLYYYLKNTEQRPAAPPIYLTANGELLRVARNVVERLLKGNAKFAQLAEGDLISGNGDILEMAFREFQPHLLSLLPVKDRQMRFARGAQVSYARFRRMWMERFGNERQALREYGPDISWHVIRSYIKGLSSEGFLEPEDYEHLPENQITVTQRTFKLVFERVWENWYRRALEDDGLWDDQDLARHVVENDLAQPTHPAVFCDEAQDFTRLELEVLLRLNLYSDRNLQPHDIRLIPFAFAGDPFQTLNPTGFRWDAIKASFVEKFILELDHGRRSGATELNYRELHFNYRSTHKIVRFGNHVQALRSALFQLPDVKPQEAWGTDSDAFPVVWFQADDASFWNKFREVPNYVIVVPCNEGEEADFVRNDPILRDHVKIEEDVPVNVLSTSRAKGCEYPAVMVYGFGQATEWDVASFISGNTSVNAGHKDSTLPLQYFINRLYVAVSRPKRRLIIVDSRKGFEKLWLYARDMTEEGKILEAIRRGQEIWAEKIEGMTKGYPENLSRERAENPFENAEAYESEGKSRLDPFLLKQAAFAYKGGGNMPKYRECRARAFEYDGNLLEAGKAYTEAGFPRDALNCFWRVGRDGWKPLIDLLPNNPELMNDIEPHLARSLVEEMRRDEMIKTLERLVDRLDRDALFAEGCLGEPVWREASEQLVLKIIESKKGPMEEGQWIRLAGMMDKLASKGLTRYNTAFAIPYFHARRFHDAIAIWEDPRTPESKPRQYHEAKASVEEYPQRILSLDQLDMKKEILQAYDSAEETPLSAEQAQVIVEVLIDAERGEEALAVGERYAPGETVMNVDWIKSLSPELQGLVIRMLARSRALAESPPHHQRPLSDYLENHLRVRGGGMKKWRGRITVEEAGAAIERAGRFMNGIRFYEDVRSENIGKDLKRFAQIRWLKCKERQLEHERSSGGPGGRANQMEEELLQKVVEWEAPSLDKISEFPELEPLGLPRQQELARQSPPTEPSPRPGRRIQPSPAIKVAASGAARTGHGDDGRRDGHAAIIGPLKIETSLKNHRCNITHQDTLEMAYLKLAQREFAGEVDFQQIAPGQWFCPAWGLSVSLQTDDGTRIVLSMKDLGLEQVIEL